MIQGGQLAQRFAQIYTMRVCTKIDAPMGCRNVQAQRQARDASITPPSSLSFRQQPLARADRTPSPMRQLAAHAIKTANSTPLPDEAMSFDSAAIVRLILIAAEHNCMS